jgi:hypothetical protein
MESIVRAHQLCCEGYEVRMISLYNLRYYLKGKLQQFGAHLITAEDSLI